MKAFPLSPPLRPDGRFAQEWQRWLLDANNNALGGTVTSVSITPANGVSGTVATPGTTPAITLALGNITPTQVASSGPVTGTNLSGTNTGDQTITLSGDASGSGTGTFAVTVSKIGGQAVSLAGALTTSGAFDSTFTMTGTTSVTFPTSGTLATVDGDLGTPSAVVLTNATGLPGSGVSAPFSAYSPTVTATSGTITTLGTVTARSTQIGKLVFVSASISITTNGTGAGLVQLTLPIGVGAFDYFGSGLALVSSKTLGLRFLAGTSNAVIQNYDGTYPGADGETLEVSGVYEAA